MVITMTSLYANISRLRILAHFVRSLGLGSLSQEPTTTMTLMHVGLRTWKSTLDAFIVTIMYTTGQGNIGLNEYVKETMMKSAGLSSK